MIVLSVNSNSSSRPRATALMIIGSLVVLVGLRLTRRDELLFLVDNGSNDANSIAVHAHRTQYLTHHCIDSGSSSSDNNSGNGTRTGTNSGDWFTPPHQQSTRKRTVATVGQVQPCEYAFFDFGANIGDSLGKFIDAGIPSCAGDNGAPTRSLHYDIATGTLAAVGAGTDPINNRNKLTAWADKMIHGASRQLGRRLEPEDYCYYGFEGNPVFTEQLRNLERRVLLSTPRPLRSVHFFTGTIATGMEGPATLYLDTVNAKQNYWGSSIYATHHDVQDGKYKVSVQGMTLTTIASQMAHRGAGNHVIIKMDIEGAEYLVLNEAYDSGVLCQLAEAAVRVDILVETHPLVRALVFETNRLLILMMITIIVQ
jgi:Methyltransferase FkbM domain